MRRMICFTMTRRRMLSPLAPALILCGLSACGQEVEVDPAWADLSLPADAHVVDEDLANAGADLFRTRCSACHYIGGDKKGLGPNLEGVTERRTQAWMRAMIANPDSMLTADSAAIALYQEYGLRMLNVDLSAAGVRAVLEYIWWMDRDPFGGSSSAPAP